MLDFQMDQTFESAMELKSFLDKMLEFGMGYIMVRPVYLAKTNIHRDRLKYSSVFLLCKHNSKRDSKQS